MAYLRANPSLESQSIVMPLEPITEFPHDFHRYKLLKRLGAGCTYLIFCCSRMKAVVQADDLRFSSCLCVDISEVYLAEIPEEIKDVPRLICLKIFTDKSHLEPGAYTVERLRMSLSISAKYCEPSSILSS